MPLAKGVNPSVLPATRGKILRQTGFFSLGKATSQGGGKLNSNQFYSAWKLTFCHILLVVEGFDKYAH